MKVQEGNDRVGCFIILLKHGIQLKNNKKDWGSEWENIMKIAAHKFDKELKTIKGPTDNAMEWAQSGLLMKDYSRSQRNLLIVWQNIFNNFKQTMVWHYRCCDCGFSWIGCFLATEKINIEKRILKYGKTPCPYWYMLEVFLYEGYTLDQQLYAAF